MSTEMPDISQLSATQKEALQSYISVTDSDPITAIPILQRAEWNVQIAIARFFDGEPTTDLVEEARAALPAATARQVSNLQNEAFVDALRQQSPRSGSPVQRVDASANAETQYRPPILLSVLFAPFSLLYRLFTTVFQPLRFLVPNFIQRLITRYTSTGTTRRQRRALPPAENARRFVQEFSEQYGPLFSNLPWAEHGFNLALDNAKKDLKFLLVVLISPSHDETALWIQDTLFTSTFTSFLGSHQSDTILWGGNVQDAEAYQVADSLGCTKFPFIALIAYDNASSGHGSVARTGMSTISRCVGSMPTTELVAKLGAAMTAHESRLAGLRAQRAEQNAQRSLREEQDSAYERSLAADRERVRRRKEEEVRVAREEKEAMDRQYSAERKRDQMHQWRRWRKASLPTEPDASIMTAIRVSVRMPDGEKVIRKFRAEAELEELYAFVECQEVSEDEAQDVDEPIDHEHQFGFRLVSPMPRKVYDVSTGGTIGETIGRGANLIVEPIADDEKDEDGT